MSAPSRQRRHLAQECARIIIENGIPDLLAAKQKAARNLGIEGNRLYPSNEEIESALAEYHRIFRPSTQSIHITRLRKVAIKAMTFLEPFTPRLVGGVLDGTAGEFAAITLILFAETPEDIIIELLNTKIPFTQSKHEVWNAKREKTHFPSFHIILNGTKLELKFLPTRYLRQLPKSKGKRLKAASVQVLRRLVEDSGRSDYSEERAFLNTRKPRN
ncbi:MAG: hypothetical protein ABFS02_04385 [Pseudomonadota bacterium]